MTRADQCGGSTESAELPGAAGSSDVPRLVSGAGASVGSADGAGLTVGAGPIGFDDGAGPDGDGFETGWDGAEGAGSAGAGVDGSAGVVGLVGAVVVGLVGAVVVGADGTGTEVGGIEGAGSEAGVVGCGAVGVGSGAGVVGVGSGVTTAGRAIVVGAATPGAERQESPTSAVTSYAQCPAGTPPSVHLVVVSRPEHPRSAAAVSPVRALLRSTR
jgi:hypothetical protein